MRLSLKLVVARSAALGSSRGAHPKSKAGTPSRCEALRLELLLLADIAARLREEQAHPTPLPAGWRAWA